MFISRLENSFNLFEIGEIHLKGGFLDAIYIKLRTGKGNNYE